MKKFLLVLFAISMLLIAISSAQSETATCAATYLYVRNAPSKKAALTELHFEQGDNIPLTGEQVDGWYRVNWDMPTQSDNGAFWVSGDYLTTCEPAQWENTSNGKVLIRDSPGGDVIGRVAMGKAVTIDRVWQGIGYLRSGGCVVLSFFTKK